VGRPKEGRYSSELRGAIKNGLKKGNCLERTEKTGALGLPLGHQMLGNMKELKVKKALDGKKREKP